MHQICFAPGLRPGTRWGNSLCFYMQYVFVYLHCALSLAAQCIEIGRVCGFVGLCVCGCVCLWVCYHNNSKLRASIFTKLGL